MNTPAAQLPAAPRKRKGCLFYGCLTTVIAVLISLVVIYFVATRALRQAVETYGSSTPIAIPLAAITSEQYLDVERRIENFRKALLANENPPALALSSQDLNALIQYDAQFKGVSGYVTFENGKILARGSVPLDPFGYKNMYLSGTAKLRVGVTADAPEMKMDDLTIGDRQLPGELMDQLRGKNLAESFTEHTGGKEFWKRIDRIEIQGDSMILHPVAAKG